MTGVIQDGVLFHGVAELRPVAANAYRLQRVPEEVRLRLHPKGATRMLAPDGCEGLPILVSLAGIENHLGPEAEPVRK